MRAGIRHYLDLHDVLTNFPFWDKAAQHGSVSEAATYSSVAEWLAFMVGILDRDNLHSYAQSFIIGPPTPNTGSDLGRSTSAIWDFATT